jgi:hypothetical protein
VNCDAAISLNASRPDGSARLTDDGQPTPDKFGTLRASPGTVQEHGLVLPLTLLWRGADHNLSGPSAPRLPGSVDTEGTRFALRAGRILCDWAVL